MMEELIKLTNALYKVTELFPTKEPLKFAIRKEALDVLFFCISSEKQNATSQLQSKEVSLKKGLDCLRMLKTYFAIAEEQKWIDSRNFIVLEESYQFFEEKFNQELSQVRLSQDIAKSDPLPRTEKREESKKENKPAVSKVLNQEKNSSVSKKVETEISKPVFNHSAGEIDYEKLSSVQLKVLELLQGSGQLKPNEIHKHFPNVSPRSIRRELQGLKSRHIIDVVGSGRTIGYKINLAV